MSVLAYQRADGLYYLVSPDKRVYELREVNLPVEQLRRAADAGLIRTCDDASCDLASPADRALSIGQPGSVPPAAPRLRLLP